MFICLGTLISTTTYSTADCNVFFKKESQLKAVHCKAPEINHFFFPGRYTRCMTLPCNIFVLIIGNTAIFYRFTSTHITIKFPHTSKRYLPFDNIINDVDWFQFINLVYIFIGWFIFITESIKYLLSKMSTFAFKSYFTICYPIPFRMHFFKTFKELAQWYVKLSSAIL